MKGGLEIKWQLNKYLIAATSVGSKNAGLIRGGVVGGAKTVGGNQVKGAKDGYAFYKSNKIK